MYVQIDQTGKNPAIPHLNQPAVGEAISCAINHI
jgi:hypothetical protein